MKLLILFFLSGCQTIIYTQACPEDDFQCQINLNAELLNTLEQTDAATTLLCQLSQYQSVLDCPPEE